MTIFIVVALAEFNLIQHTIIAERAREIQTDMELSNIYSKQIANA